MFVAALLVVVPQTTMGSLVTIEYQIGTKAIEDDGTVWAEYWSDWASDGNEAEVTYEDMSWPGIIAIRIVAPGYHVEYQIGTKAIEDDGTVWAEYLSDWASDGNEAEVTYEDMSWPGIFSMRAIFEAPKGATIDMDPNTLNLKSKGKWVTGYIGPPGNYNVDDVNINTVLLEDSIPIEWSVAQKDILMVKFDRSELEDKLSPGTFNLKVTGELKDGTTFEGYSDEIRVIDPS
jgi:hypothetical protein